MMGASGELPEDPWSLVWRIRLEIASQIGILTQIF
ncbi:hypothetical protein MAMC_02056 [Methylacidimicrobium cyclopophantes]|uniref:Uncharacterized protein n=1 Tax=Methylacidimicrobium cyclopophantes TaxID=1041766 RepID=A0A5E6MH31_9BACT|nr:hypothetical protein MAMC_02056 [Methylacidimicrobium cyclopophantes]